MHTRLRFALCVRTRHGRVGLSPCFATVLRRAADIAKESNRNPELTDIYQFGVYVGGSLNVIRSAWELNDLPIGGVWGFDSFIGLQSGAKADGDGCETDGP